jgi:hypothetical protein
MVKRYTSVALKEAKPNPPVKKGFQPGNAQGKGRPKGAPNKTTGLIKDAISGACERLGELEPIWQTRTYKFEGRKITEKIKIIGWKPTGKGGAMGYMIWLGCNYPTAFAALVGRMLPMQVNATGSLDLTVAQRFSDVEIVSMPLSEKMALMSEMIGMTKPLAAPEPKQTQPGMIEGTATRVREDQ